MRALIATLVAGLLAISGATATAKPAPPKPDLRTSDVLPVLTGSSLAVYATVTNKGKKKAKASTAAFYLSTDTAQSAGDVLLGTSPVAKLKPKKRVIVYPTFTVSAPAGTYYVVVCADSEQKVKEKKEGNNCAASSTTVVVGSTTVPPPPGSYSFKIASYAGWIKFSVDGALATTVEQNLVFPAGSNVVVTVTPNDSLFKWTGDWESPDPSKPCDGTKVLDSDTSGSITFTSLSHNVDCLAWGRFLDGSGGP